MSMVMLPPAPQCRGSAMEKGGGGDDGLRTVECLRGRLLAERVTSKSAKEEADRLAKMLQDLEKKLSEEVEHRTRAEKRMENALKRLESMKVSDGGGHWRLPESSTGPLSSHGLLGHQPSSSSSTSSSSEAARSDPLTTDSGQEADGVGGGADCSSSTGSCLSIGHEEETTDAVRQENVSTDKAEEITGEVIGHHENKLALVLVPASAQQPKAEPRSPEMKNNVQAVLLALRQVKEQLQCSITGRSAEACCLKELYSL